MNKITHFSSFIASKSIQYETNRQFSAISTNIPHKQQKNLKVISRQKNKVDEKRHFKSQDNNFYTKLERKLKEQLKYMNNHATPEVKEKMVLKERCRTQKHMRKVSANMVFNLNARRTNFQSRVLSRPKTNYSKRNLTKNNKNLYYKVNGIMDMCGVQKEKFQELKNDFGVISFYKKNVQKNSQKILKKIL